MKWRVVFGTDVRYGSMADSFAISRLCPLLGGISISPTTAASPPKPGKAEISFLEKNEVPLLLRAAKETPMFTLVFMALNTGMRRGELLGLRWSDIDLDLSFLNVRQTLQFTRANGIEFKEPKTDSSKRKITLPSIAVEVLRTRKAAQLRERLMLGLGKDETALVFTREDQQPIAPYNITKAFNRLVKKAGIQKITFHGLRHTHISHLLADGIDIKTVSERAGHSSASITLDVYSHVLEKTQELAAQTVDVAMRAALED